MGYSYDALGNVISQSAFGNPTSAIAYQYTGQEFDRETGLHNFRARLYDSELFRFYATDPADEQHSPYAFVGNSPLMFRDPTGAVIDPFTAALIFAGFNALSSGAIAASNDGNFFAAAGRSLLGSAISFGVSAGVGAGLNMAFGTLDPFINTAGDFALRGALQGGLSGAISSAIMGGNALQGGLTGGGMGALGGLGQYGAYEQAYQNWLSEPVSLDGALADVIYQNQHGQEVARTPMSGEHVYRKVDETTVSATAEFSTMEELGIGFLPVVSSIFDARKAFYQFQAGDYLSAGGNILMAGAGLVSGGGIIKGVSKFFNITKGNSIPNRLLGLRKEQFAKNLEEATGQIWQPHSSGKISTLIDGNKEYILRDYAKTWQGGTVEIKIGGEIIQKYRFRP